MNSLESQRRKTANIVLALAKLAEDHDDLLNLLDAKFGDLPFLSEEGCYRQVFQLPNKLVLKLCNHELEDNHRHNLVEYRLSKTYPDYVARTYGRHRKGKVDVLIAEKLDRVGKVPLLRKSARYRTIYKKFQDAYGVNLGWRGDKLVLLDVGCGLR